MSLMPLTARADLPMCVRQLRSASQLAGPPHAVDLDLDVVSLIGTVDVHGSSLVGSRRSGGLPEVRPPRLLPSPNGGRAGGRRTPHWASQWGAGRGGVATYPRYDGAHGWAGNCMNEDSRVDASLAPPGASDASTPEIKSPGRSRIPAAKNATGRQPLPMRRRSTVVMTLGSQAWSRPAGL